MGERQDTLAHGNSFLIFEEQPDFDDCGAPKLVESKALAEVSDSKSNAYGAAGADSLPGEHAQ